MSALKLLKAAKTRQDLAYLLGMELKRLNFAVYALPEAIKYRRFEIPKKSGEARIISSPFPPLKNVQRRLSDLLYKCKTEIDEKLLKKMGRSSTEYLKSKNYISHAFQNNGPSIFTNAEVHARARYVLNLDLENFFGTITFPRVRAFFINDRNFELSPEVATCIAQIACLKSDGLPQGSPCSPLISELFTRILDLRLLRFAIKNRLLYSRYADDLTFSSRQEEFPQDCARRQDGDGNWELGEEITGLIRRAGFVINNSKTRMHIKPSKQTVTGLVVNEKVNIDRRYKRWVRTLSNNLFTQGWYERSPPTTDPLTGLVTRNKESSLAPIEGMLSHIFHSSRFRSRQEIKDFKKAISDKKNPGKFPVQPDTLYRKFRYFSKFVCLSRPLIMSEGKTDITYLKMAIKHSPAFHKSLLINQHAEGANKVDFFCHDIMSDVFFGFGEGHPSLMNFMKNFEQDTGRYQHLPLKAPIIVLLDNDDAMGNQTTQNLSKWFNVTATQVTTLPFYKLHKHLYLVKTPEFDPPRPSKIEDLFDQALFEKLVDGKKISFENKKRHGSSQEVSKAVFAEKVVLPNAAEIDWSGFAALLARIEAVLLDYAQHGPKTDASPNPAQDGPQTRYQRRKSKTRRS
jgi:RNA-directed DNA polymerase